VLCERFIESEDKDPGEPLSLSEIFSPHFAVRNFDSAWISANKRTCKHYDFNAAESAAVLFSAYRQVFVSFCQVPTRQFMNRCA